jgi:hypothetical protein
MRIKVVAAAVRQLTMKAVPLVPGSSSRNLGCLVDFRLRPARMLIVFLRSIMRPPQFIRGPEPSRTPDGVFAQPLQKRHLRRQTGITIHGRPDRPARRWRPWNVPSAFWFVGGTNPDTYSKAQETGRLNEIPTNHNPRFLPVIHPTLETGVEALIVAAEAWMSFTG